MLPHRGTRMKRSFIPTGFFCIIVVVISCKTSESAQTSDVMSAFDGHPPTTTGNRLEVAAVVKAMQEIQRVDGAVSVKSSVEACTANDTPHWSPIVSHFYCQIGRARACFTGYVRDSSKANFQTNQSYRDAYNYCAADSRFSWIPANPIVAPVFKYIMFTVYGAGVDAFTIDSQDQAIN